MHLNRLSPHRQAGWTSGPPQCEEGGHAGTKRVAAQSELEARVGLEGRLERGGREGGKGGGAGPVASPGRFVPLTNQHILSKQLIKATGCFLESVVSLRAAMCVCPRIVTLDKFASCVRHGVAR